MKILFFVLGLVGSLLVACSPSEETIAAAIAETQAAWTPIPPLPSYTPYPTFTPIPSNTPSPSPEHTPTATASPTISATNTRRPTSTPKPTPLNGKWETRTGTSAFDDSETVTLFLDANSEINGWTGTYLPTLILRCKEKDVEAYVVIGMQADVENAYETHTVRIRFDDEDAYTTTMSESTDGEALFFQGYVAPLINKMQEHDTMLFGFTPFNSNPVQTTFTLTGLPYAVGPLADACN